jgi:putative ABC transport system permease protein
MMGLAQLEVVAGEVGVPESVLETVRGTPGVRAASPLVSIKVRLVEHPFPLNIIGLDLLAEEEVRKTEIERNGLEIRDPLRLLATPDAVVVTETLLTRLGLIERYRNGEIAEIPVRAGERKAVLKVQGALRPTGVAAAYSGQVVVMDIYAAQLLGAREGRFDRIDVVPVRDEDLPSLLSELSARLNGIATVQRSSARSGIAEDMLDIVRRSALIIAGAAAIVSCLLTYATMSQWVERQQRQLATLRAVGMEARRVGRMIFTEVLVLSAIGTVLGVAAGVAVSPPLLDALSTFVEIIGTEEMSGTTFELSTLVLATLVGLVSGIAGGVVPARRAARRFTLDSIDAHMLGGSGARLASQLGWLALAALIALVAAGRNSIEGAALLRVTAVLMLGVIATITLAPSLLRALRLPLRWAEKFRPDLSHLATRFLRARPLTFAVALSAISTLVGVLVAVFLLIETIQSAMVRWSEARLVGSPTFVFATPIGTPAWNELLSPATMDVIRTTKGVAAVNEQYRGLASIVFRGEPVPLAVMDIEAVMLRGHIASVGRSSQELGRGLMSGEVAISPGFTVSFGVSEGDSLELDTPKGRRTFKVAGLYEDFGEKNGSILMDLRTYDEFWDRSGATSAVIWIDGSEASVIKSIQERVGLRQDLFFEDSAEILSLNREISEVFTSTLYVLGTFTSLLGAIGVMILLAGVVAERRRDLSLLRAAGAEPRQLVAVILADAVVLGFLGATGGCLLGFACAGPAADVPREGYGWLLEQRWFAPQIPVIVAGAFAAAVVGALLPARMASRTHPDEVFGPE